MKGYYILLLYNITTLRHRHTMLLIQKWKRHFTPIYRNDHLEIIKCLIPFFNNLSILNLKALIKVARNKPRDEISLHISNLSLLGLLNLVESELQHYHS